MKLLYLLLGLYLLFINLDAFLLMRADKRRAQKGQRRIPEATLFMTAILGGGPGALLGMNKFRHKTKHVSFTVGIPLIIFFEFILLVVVLYLAYRGPV